MDKEWEDDGWLGLFGSLWGGISSGTSAWWEGEGDFWNSVGEWLSNIPDMLGDAWEAVSDAAKQLWETRDQILGLLKNLADGAVAAFEAGFEAVADLVASIPDYEELTKLFSDLVEHSAEWRGAMIEMATETRVLAVLGATVLGTFMMIPPNVWTEMVGKGAGYLIPELVIVIILAIVAFFTAGTGGGALAARITTYTAKITADLSKAERTGSALMRVFTLLKSIKDRRCRASSAAAIAPMSAKSADVHTWRARKRSGSVLVCASAVMSEKYCIFRTQILHARSKSQICTN